ncbi:cellulose biosynthesis protein BcsN [Mesorhizobium erdmanii]|uniref:cellulose biosynthesis protein BcsN n=1 Tax=Mesorhizobium erdmanii TaxID=1777866 RepID=UPI0004100AE4|nr:cellulose biosynthesis protein BcsN [Mesorhizobium erdmanii]
MMSVAVLAGCAGPAPIVNPSGTSLASAETAFAFPPPGGPAITAILERRFTNATQQDILLSTSAHTPGQNTLRVQLFGPVDTSLAGQGRLRDGYLPIGDLGSEMRQMLPGIRMQRSPYYVQNKYGPFGYAVGRAASGDTCLYGWQRISSTGVTQTWIGNKGSVQVRLRLCDQGASEQKLLDIMYGYTITSYFKSRNWNPYGEPVAPDESLGKPGHPIYPVGVTRFETVTAPASAKPAPRIVRRRDAAGQQPVQSLAHPVGPLVPAPPGGRTAQTLQPAASQPVATGNAVVGSGPITIVPSPPCAQTSAAAGCGKQEDTAR